MKRLQAEKVVTQGSAVRDWGSGGPSPAPLLVQTGLSPLGLYFPLMESVTPGLKRAPHPRATLLTSGSKIGAESCFSNSAGGFGLCCPVRGPLATCDYLKLNDRASLVAQWLRICLPMQGTRVRALVWEDPTCRGATRPTKPVSYNY